MHVEIFGDLLDGFDALERFERHTGFEFGVVSSAFCFHSLCVFGSVLQTSPAHHNHSLASGLNFGVRLKPPCRIKKRIGFFVFSV